MRVRLKDIAGPVGVSVQTVSAVLNRTKTSTMVSEETRRRILELAQTMGYVRDARAASLVNGRSSTIGVTCFNLRDPHYLQAIEVAERVCAEHDHTLIVATARQGLDWAAKLAEGRVDFLLVIAMGLLDWVGQQIPVGLQQHVAVVGGMVRPPRRQWAAQMTWDDRLGGAMAVEHLLDQGCRRIALLAGSQTGSVKLLGARERLQAAGLEPVLIQVDDESDAIAAGQRMGEILIERAPDIDGVFLRTDRFYPGLLHAYCQTRAAGITLPRLVGYGGFYANLTSVCTPMNACVQHVLTTYFREGVDAIKDRRFDTTLKPRL